MFNICFKFSLESSLFSVQFLFKFYIELYQMKRIPFILFLVLFTPTLLSAQICMGKVIAAESRKPIRYANVFLASTLLGTTSDKSGVFEFDTKGNISIPLIISYVGYRTVVTSVSALKTDSVVRLQKEIRKLDEIDVKADPGGWSRNKMLRVFKEEFLGTSFNAQSCKIRNEDDIYLYYNQKTKTLHANSQNPIIIENRLLNYKIFYLLESFKKSDSGIKFKGYSSFEELEIKNKKHQRRILKQRKTTYFGSIMHFMRFMYKDKIHENDTIYSISAKSETGMLISENILVYSENNKELDSLTIKPSRIYTELDYSFTIDRFQLYDIYGGNLLNREIIEDFDNRRKLCYDKRIKVFYFGKMWNSYLVLKSDCVEIFENGYYDPELISWYGTMSKYRVGDLLPFDYEYSPILK